MPLPPGLAPFRQQRFTILWAGALTSSVGTWMATVAVGILVTKQTGQAAWTGIAAAAAYLPGAVVAPIGGALADRVARRPLLLVAAATQGFAAMSLALITSADHVSPTVVSLLVLVDGSAGAVVFPLLIALVPELVAREHVPNAMNLSIAQYNIGRVIGPAFAALLLTTSGYPWVFVANAGSAVVMIVAICSVRLAAPPVGVRVPLLTSIADGVRFARRDPGMRSLFVLYWFYGLCAAPFIALVPAMAIEVLHEGKTGTSILVTSQGVGAILAAVIVGAVMHRIGQRRVFLASYAAYPAGLVLYALAPSSWPCALAIFLLGLINATCFSGFASLAQLRAPEELRGRMASLMVSAFGIVFPLAAIAHGALGDAVGLRVTTAGAAILMAVVFVALRVLRPGFDADLRDAQGPDPHLVAPPIVT